MSKMSEPLIVDLDGTLTTSDVLLESFLAMLKTNLLLVFLVPFWLLRGKAYLKAQIARRADINVALLPYNHELIDYLAAQKAAGRRLVLASASNRKFVTQVAGHLGLFNDVIASDDRSNLAGSNKAEQIAQLLQGEKFSYAGNAAPDLNVWRHASKAILVGPKAQQLRARLPSSCAVENVFETRAAGPMTYIKAMRLHQWVKNILVLAPVIAGHRFDGGVLLAAVQAFFAFGLCASSVYLINDLLDLEADRVHASKRNRPLASGRLPIINALLLAPILLVAAFTLALTLPIEFVGVLLVYFICTTLYSFALKRVVMLDVIMLAGLYTLRIIGGAVAADIPLSFWLLAFSMFVFLSLAMIKRYTELLTLRQSNASKKASGRGYVVEDLALVSSLGGASGYMSVLVLALYLNSDAVRVLYEHSSRLWALCPVFLFWISRMWMIAHRGRMDDDPVVFALKDRGSQLTVAVMAAIFVFASMEML